MSRFAATLASQIAIRYNGAAHHIKAALRANPGLLKVMSCVDQMELLVYNTIRSATARWYRPFGIRNPIVIVIDGLDECDEKEEASAFIKQLIHLFERKPAIPLRFLITSRVEDHLHRRLHKSNQVRLLNLVDKTSDEDIAAALDAAIEDAKGSRVLSACEDTWLSPGDRQKLIEHIGGSFIFMSTITRFLFSPSNVDGLTPIERLPLALNMNPGFDGLYTSILQGSDHFPHFSEIVSTVALVQEPLSITQMADLLNIDITKVVNVLVSLHAIFQVPGDDHTPITLWHSSLRDFLCTEDRSRALFASPLHHRHLAYRCGSLTLFSANLASSISLSPASYYAKRFAAHHWRKFLEGIANSSNSLRTDLDGVIAHLQANVQTENQIRFLNLVDKASDEDITAALDVAISDAKGSRVLATCEDTWLSQVDRQKLIKHIEGSFIFMTKITKFLFSTTSVDGLTPIERLPLALNMNPGFDGLYAAILQASSHFPHSSDVVSTIALAQEPLSITQISDLLNVNNTEVVEILVSLHKIFLVPGNDRTPITLWHSSLRDFLRSEDRSGPLFAGPTHHRHLAYRCFALAPLSSNSVQSPASGYSERFAIHHWRKFIEGIPNSGGSLKAELDSALAHLQATLSEDFLNTAPTLFHLDRRFLEHISQGERWYTVSAIRSTFCRVELYEQNLGWRLIKAIFDEIFVNDADDALLFHLFQFHPYLIHPSHHLEVTAYKIHRFVKWRLSSGAFTLYLSASLFPDAATAYFFTCWARHLALAIQTEPRCSIFSTVEPTPIEIDSSGNGRYERSSYECPHWMIKLGASNLELALRIIEATTGSERSLAMKEGKWDWDSEGFAFAEPADSKPSITVYDVLNGIHSLLSCMQATCSHGQGSPGDAYCQELLRHASSPETPSHGKPDDNIDMLVDELDMRYGQTVSDGELKGLGISLR